MESVCTILTILDESKLAGAINQTVLLPKQVLFAKSKTDAGEHRDEICKAISMYAGCARAINDMPDSVVVSTLQPMFGEIWSHLQHLMQLRSNDIELMDQCC